ncbi:hypothetical protein FQP90_00835 [Paenarthrobacter nitroguajacolicus]|uniref:Uncharacterized protein n=1 Tax=Paenarthrobacter nitroguajacolicus TaxID=211146 RepID=A0A558HC76_PAENT|nr:hypothetical protein [Paenarthrobacter nitroguajacolicus]TVU66721.1 hypothetical protein FQP90_00835 [Paenarthrobacter nitroguajacolicus]
MTRIIRPASFAAWLTVSTAGILLALTACAVPAPTPRETIPHDADTGQTIAEAREAIDAVPGISVTGFAGGGPPNVKGNTGYSVELAIDTGYTVLYGDLLVDYIVRNVWSVGEGYMPNTQIQISARTADGEPFFDLTTAGVGSAWMGGQPSAPSQHSTIIIPLAPTIPRASAIYPCSHGTVHGLATHPSPSLTESRSKTTEGLHVADVRMPYGAVTFRLTAATGRH